jgi:hypothetical protein
MALPGSYGSYFPYLKKYGLINNTITAPTGPAAPKWKGMNPGARAPSGIRAAAAPTYGGILGYLQSMLVSPAQQRANALAEARAAINESLVGLRADRDEMLRQQLAQSNRAQGFAGAIANMTAADPATIKGYYSDAANALGAYGTGLTGAVAAAQQGNQDAAQAEASKATGGLGSVQSYDIGGLRNVAQLTGVTQPATTLQEEAANAATAAVFGRQAQAGQIENIAQDYLGKMDETRRSYMSDAEKLQATRAKLFQDAYDSERTNAMNVVNSLIQAQYLGKAMTESEASLTGKIPGTNIPTYDAQQNAAKNALDQAAIDQRAAEASAQAAAKNATARNKAVAARDHAWDMAWKSMPSSIARMTQTVKVPADPNDPLSTSTTKKVLPKYAAAKKQLMADYGYLLQYANPSGKAALQKKLANMVDMLLRSHGIKPNAVATDTADTSPVWVPPGGWTPGLGAEGTPTGGYVR